MIFLSNLTQRDKQPEIMDQAGLAVEDHQQALRGLTRINWISRSAEILWQPIRRLAEEKPGQPQRVLDLGTGAGDVPIRLEKRARQAGLPITFAGADISPTALDFARERALACGAQVDFFLFDALHMPLPTDYDIITCSLFLHHLEAEQAADLLRRMAQAARSMILINDLIRSRLGYLLAYVGTRTLSTSYVVREDGMKSVRAAFTMAEARQLAEQAELKDAKVSWHWPCRFLLQWKRQVGL
jgi:2-polyprenyl-3-methyl-5-hydroxy-6-metoxy-1,4-benzoquinol methylase